jgi:hypothetical protein
MQVFVPKSVRRTLIDITLSLRTPKRLCVHRADNEGLYGVYGIEPCVSGS